MPKKPKDKLSNRAQDVWVRRETAPDENQLEPYFSPGRLKKMYKDQEDEESEPVDMTKIDRKDPGRRKRILGLIILSLFVLLLAALAGFYIFTRNEKKFSGTNVQLEIKAAQNVTSGSVVTFTITYTNKEKVSLENVDLTIQYPSGFTYQSSSLAPEGEEKNSWLLDNIKTNGQGQLEVTGKIIGELNEVKTISAILTYFPSNFHSEFQKRTSDSFTINASPIGLALDTPIRAVAGKEATFKIKYKNNAGDLLDKVRITATYPDGLNINSIDPKPKEGNNLWEIDNLEKDQSGEIVISAVFNGQDGEYKEIQAEAGLVEEDNMFTSQEEESSLILIINPQMTLTLLINDSENNLAASLGDQLNYVIKYENSGEIDIKDMVIEAELAGDVVDWSTLIDKKKGKHEGDKITWDKKNIPGLASVKKGDAGQINFSVSIIKNITVKADSNQSYSVVSKVSGHSSQLVDLGGSSLEIASNSIAAKIRTDLKLTAEARYYSDEYLPIGSGPLPPVVGQTTNYRIYWYITNTINEADNVKVTTTLPTNVTWTGRSSVSAGHSLTFDPNTREVAWEINKVPAGTGQAYPELEADFEVSITPTQDDVGKIMVLTQNSAISATDFFTEEIIQKQVDLLTTNLEEDPSAKGKGIVVSGS